MTEAGIHSNLLRDVYVVMADPVPGDKWAMRFYVNPLVQLIWWGTVIILSGLLLSLSTSARRAGLKQAVGVPEQAKPAS
jgi:cytochrome c-type biogenesis protein CcmF